MMDNTKVSAKQEHELSMDEILSSIRNIITEDQETRAETRRLFPEDSTTNPSGARMIEDLPKFDRDDSFPLPDFKEDPNRPKLEARGGVSSRSIFPDEDFEVSHDNERSFREQREPYLRQEQYSREAASTEDRISKALRGIVESYGQHSYRQDYQEKPLTSSSNSSRLAEVVASMVEKTMVVRIEEWLHKNLPAILEKAILRELERIASQMKI